MAFRISSTQILAASLCAIRQMDILIELTLTKLWCANVD